MVIKSLSILLLSSSFMLVNGNTEESSSVNEDSPIVLPSYTVYGSHLSDSFQSLHDSDSTVSLSGTASLNDAFQKWSSVFYNAPIGPAGTTEVSIRAGEANFTKVMVDGIEVNNPVDNRGGGVAFSGFEAMPFATASLRKGANSSVMGSGAMAGVLALELGDSRIQTGGFANGTYGSWGYQKLQAGAGYRSSDMGFGFQAGVFSEEENDRYEGHEFSNEGAYLKASYKIDSKKQLSISALNHEIERMALPEDSGGILYAVNRVLDEIDSETTLLSLRYLQAFDNDSLLRFSLGRFENDQQSSSPGVPPGERNPFGVPANRFDDSFSRLQFDGSYQVNLIDNLSLAVGSSFRRESATSVSEVDIYPGFTLPGQYDVDRDLLSGFIEAGIAISDGQSVVIAERYNKVSNQDSQWSGSIRYAYDVSEGLEFFISYSEAFKAPSLFALNNAMVGNASLEAETSDLWESGVSGVNQSGNFNWKAAVFLQSYDSMIDMAEATQQMMNLSSVDVKGIEFAGQLKLTEDTTLQMQTSFLSIDVNEADEILRFRPETTANLTITKTIFGNQDLSLSYRYTGGRWDSSIPTGNVELEEDHELSLQWLGTLSENLEAMVVLQNLLNQKNQMLIGYEKSGVGGRVGLRFSFGD